MQRRATVVRRLVLGLVVAVVGAFSAAPQPPAVTASEPEAAPQTRVVRFGSPSAVSDAGVFIARDRGYFREVGLDVESVHFQSGPNTVPAMASGDLETAGGTLSVATLNAVDRGIDLKMVADKGTSRPGFEYVQVPLRRALWDSGEVRDVAGLRGRTIAVASLQSGAESLVARILSRGGLGIGDVNLIPLEYSDMVVAYGNGAIDASYIIEPATAAARERGLIVEWEPGHASAAVDGVYQGATLVYAGQFAAQTDSARRFMVGYLRGLRDYNDAFVKGQGRADVVRILTESTSLKDPAIYDRMQMAGLDPDGRLSTQSLQWDLDYFRQMGYYSGPSTLSNLVDTSFAEYAAQQLGPYQ
jgi:NitT/TauT family transport system substrate-binding protein